jgi:prolyl-tRNA synthetase
VRVLRKVEAIVREEMNRAGAQEVLMPALQPPEIWQASGRYETARDVLFKLKDSAQREWVLSPTAEEVITTLAAAELNSYRQMPVNFYQISVKFRDEIRPRFGLMRAKEFYMKDAYSFDATDEGAMASYLRAVRTPGLPGRGRHRSDRRQLLPRVHGPGRHRRE